MDFINANGLYSNDMTPGPPPLLLEQQQQQEAVDLDALLGNMLCRLMDGQLAAADAIAELHQHTSAVVQFYRSEAADELAPAARRLNLAKMAAELEGQAASWQLMQALYCTDGMPAGVYESAANVGERLTMRQLLADTVNSDDNLRRFAQVVMWLETLASQKLPADPVQLAASYRFGSQEGVWKDTLRGLGGHGRPGADVELDPDAVSRDQLKLAVGDMQNEQRLAAWVWRLVRAGRYKEACELCANAGQPWRGVSLAGVGPWGPLPVGDAAAQASTTLEREGALQEASEELAAEVEAGAAGARLAWKWACYMVAAAAGPAEDGEGGSKYEAALYGALCGDVKAMLPACDSWEDEAWAYCRAFLELSSDAQLLQSCRGDNTDPQARAAAQTFYLGQAGDSSEAEVPLDLLEGVVDLAARSGYTKQAPKKQLLREGLAVMNGDWPLHRFATDGNRSLLPGSLRELYDLLSSSSNSAVASAARSDQHILQVQLMSEAWVDLVSQLNSTARRAMAQLQELQTKQQRAAAAASQSGQHDGDSSMQEDEEGMDAGYGGTMVGYDGISGGDGAVSADAAVDVLRFNAHMALALRALGLLPDPGLLPMGEDQNDVWATLQVVCSQVINHYACHLARQLYTVNLVPAYICHLRLAERRALATIMLQTALTPEDDAQAVFVYQLLTTGTAYWYDHQLRQQQQQQDDEEGAVRHQLFGDLRPEEARLLLQYHVYSAFSSAATSPQQRCDTLRWMLFGFIEQQQAVQAAPSGLEQQQFTWEGSWADALGNSLGLATQLVLNPGFGGPAVNYLMQEVIPEGFVAAATAAAADAAAGDPSAADVSSSTVSRASGVDVVQAAGQLQVQRQLLALTFWQRYAGLEERYQAWKQTRSSAVLSARVEPGTLGSLEDAVQLLQEMLILAGADALRLPAPQWLAETVSNMAEGEEGAGAAAAVAEGEWLCMPQYDAPVNPLMLAAYAEGTVEQVLGLLPYSELQLAITVPRHQPGRTGLAAARQDMQLPYRRLEMHELAMLQSSVDAFLQNAAASCPDVTCETEISDPEEPLSGCLLVRLRCYSRADSSSSSSSSGRAVDSRELQVWQDMVSVAVALMDAGSGRGAVGSEGVEGSAVPRLNVVYLNSSLSTQLAISRRRTTSKLLRRSAKVLSVLTRQGYRGVEGDHLLSLASDGDECSGLLSQLSQGDAVALLDRLTGVLAEVEDGSAVDVA